MKKIYTLLSAIALVGYCTAQSLTNTNSGPVAGDMYTYYVADSNATPGPGGAGQTWDFSNLHDNGSATSFMLMVVNASQTPDYPTHYSTSSVADTTTGQPTTYYTSSASSLNSQGLVMGVSGLGRVILEFDNDDEQLLTYPFAMGDNFTDAVSGTAYATVNMIPVTIAMTGADTVTADGSGTVKLPNGITITNVLRVKTQDGFSGNTALGPVSINSTRYDFYATDSSKYPILRFVHSNFNGTILNFVWSQYPLTPMGIQKLTNINSFNVYPNPANNEVNIKVDVKNTQNVQIKLYDMTGKVLKTITKTQLSGSNTFTVNTSNLSAGIYNLVLTSNNKNLTKRLVIK